MNSPSFSGKRPRPGGALRLLPSAALALAASALLCGCAYFNTYYNAKKLFDQAGRNRGGFPDTATAGPAEAGLYQKSVDKFAAVVAKYSSSRWAAPSVFYMAEATYRRGEYPKALGLYEDVWRFYPATKYADRARLGFAMTCWRTGEYERALRMLASITGADSHIRERSSFLAALVSQSMENYSEASLQWERFLYQHPKSGLSNQARFHRARCLMATDNYAGAIGELETMLDRRMKKGFRFQTMMSLASAMEKAGRAEEALALYRKLEKTAVNPADQRTILLNMARIRASNEEPDSARGIFREVAEKYPKTEASAGAFYSMAELWEQENVMDSARAYYTMARQESPGSAVAEDALRAASDIAVLQALGSQAADDKSREQNAAIQFMMAEHYLFQLDQPDQAVERYRSVYASYPELPISAKALYAAGWVLLRSKADTAAADSAFNLLVERYPSTRYANAARERLGLPFDTTVADSEPEIGLAAPISITLDTLKTPKGPEGSAPDTSAGPKLPSLPGLKPDAPGEGPEKDRMKEENK